MENIPLDRTRFSVLQFIYDHPYITYPDLKQHFPAIPNLEVTVNALEQARLISFRKEGFADADEGYEVLYLDQSPYLLSLPAGNVIIENEARRIEEFNKQLQPLREMAESAKKQAELAIAEANTAKKDAKVAKVRFWISLTISILALLGALLANAHLIVPNVIKILTYLGLLK